VKKLTDLQRWNRKEAAYHRRKELRERAVAYLGGKCRICGYDKCTAAYDFHHEDMQAKDFEISSALTSWERIKPELDKCILLCSNCHREVHDGLHPTYLVDYSAPGSMYDLSWDDEIDQLDS
jgi:predicted HNH restriction endonuclease